MMSAIRSLALLAAAGALGLGACDGDPTGPRLGSNVVSVATGMSYTCAATRAGAVYCWGKISYLGGESRQWVDCGPALASRCSTVPVRVEPSVPLRSLAGGSAHICGLDVDGVAYCWGAFTLGRLGIGPVDRDACFDGTSDRCGQRPERVAGAARFDALAAGGLHTCAIAGNAAYCWGSATDGQIGAGPVDSLSEQCSVECAATPTPVAGTHSWRAVAAGDAHSCAIDLQGRAFCWGRNQFGQLGRGAGNVSWSDAPTAVASTATFQTIAAGGSFSCGVDAAGQAYCWGLNSSGQLGNNATIERCDFFLGCSTTPVAVVGGLSFESLSLGSNHACGIATDGRAYCWGSNGSGQLGDGSVIDAGTPQPVAGNLRFRALSAGGEHTCGITTGGALYCWGSNIYGQVGGRPSGEPVHSPRLTRTPLAF